jgi:segregation and condensation protein A
MEPLTIKLQMYEGPLDLLLDLIRKNEMDITNIPMAEITRQYLDHLNQMKALNLEIAGEFLVVAATLVLIKSKMLLPADETLQEGEGEGEDPRAELVRKLIEYQAFKEAAKELEEKEDERARIFTRKIADYYFADLTPEDVGIDTFSANLYDLFQAFARVVQSIGKESFHEVFEEIISIDQKIDDIKKILEQKNQVYFKELFQPQSTRNELIVTFLGILELTKRKYLGVKQSRQFDDILLEKLETVPEGLGGEESSSRPGPEPAPENTAGE